MKYTVSGLGAVFKAMEEIDGGVKSLRSELRPAMKTLRTSLREETPVRDGELRSTVRGSVSRLRISAAVGNAAKPYAKWNMWGKKSPNRYFANRALYGSIKKVETQIGLAVQRVINKHM